MVETLSAPAAITQRLAVSMPQRVRDLKASAERYAAQADNPAVRDFLIQQSLCAAGTQTRHSSTWTAEAMRKAPVEQTLDPFYHTFWFNISALPTSLIQKVTATVWCLPDEAQDDMLTYVVSQKQRGGLLTYQHEVTDGLGAPVFSTFHSRRSLASAIWILPAVWEVTTQAGQNLVFTPGMDFLKLRRKLSQRPQGAPPIPENRIICPRYEAPVLT